MIKSNDYAAQTQGFNPWDRYICQVWWLIFNSRGGTHKWDFNTIIFS